MIEDGRGDLGRLPPGRYRLVGSGFESVSFDVRSGQTTTVQARPKRGIVILRPQVSGPLGGIAVRVVPGHLESLIGPGSTMRMEDGGVLLTGRFITAMGEGFEKEDSLPLVVLPGKWTVELFRPAYKTVRIPIHVTPGSVQTLEPPLVESDTTVAWPPWPQ